MTTILSASHVRIDWKLLFLSLRYNRSKSIEIDTNRTLKTKSIKIDNHKEPGHRFWSISDINRLIIIDFIDFDRVSELSMCYVLEINNQGHYYYHVDLLNRLSHEVNIQISGYLPCTFSWMNYKNDLHLNWPWCWRSEFLNHRQLLQIQFCISFFS